MAGWAGAWDVERVFAQLSAHPAVPGQALTKGELRKVWLAVSGSIGDALRRGKGVAVPFFGTFTLFRREIRDPASFTAYSIRTPLFHLDPAFESTYHLAPSEASAAANATRLASAVPAFRLPFSVLQEKTGLARTVVSAALRDTVRFVGEGVFRGTAYVLEFPGVGRVYVRASQCKAVFGEGLVAALHHADVGRAGTPHRRMFPAHANQQASWPSSSPSPRLSSDTGTSPHAPLPIAATGPPPDVLTLTDGPQRGRSPGPPAPRAHRGVSPAPPPRPRATSCTAAPRPPSAPFKLGSPRQGFLFQELKPKAPAPAKLTPALRGRTLVRKSGVGGGAPKAVVEAATQTGPAVIVPYCMTHGAEGQTGDDTPLPTEPLGHAPPPRGTAEPAAAAVEKSAVPPPPASLPPVPSPPPPLVLYNPFVRDEAGERQRQRERAVEVEQENLRRSAAKRAALEAARREERARALRRLAPPQPPTAPPEDAEADPGEEEEEACRQWLEHVANPPSPRQLAA